MSKITEVKEMDNTRTNRVAEQMKKEIGEIINQKIKDPRVGFVTVTDIDLTNDLQHATVYVSVLGDESEKEESLIGLSKASGFIRSEEIGRGSCRERVCSVGENRSVGGTRI